ncbi:MAG: hypothetical protein CL670_08460 [Balneola sp.]|jgi:chemotaxis protein MotB|nr:hypothetical protein [Balneola sp.]MBE79170.1 hypothetical protein [Balneola sp.]
MGKSDGNSQDWLVTYSDLVTLILTFFVLLYTMTSGVEEKAFNSFLQYFQNDAGFLPEATAMTETINNQVDPEEMQELVEEQLERWQSFADFLEENDLTDEVEVKMISDGIKITLSDSLTFESGSSELLPNAKDILKQVAGMIDNKVEEIEVQGHTDNVPIARDSYYKTNWHLGAGRSVSVVEFLQESANVDPQRFKATSFGEYHPVETNETVEGRRKNRRVEIYLRDLIIQDDINPIQTLEDDVPTTNSSTF